MNELLPFIPEQHRAKVFIALALSPYITRAYHALSTGGGIKGVMRSIWLGTNTPKELCARVQNIEAKTENLTKP